MTDDSANPEHSLADHVRGHQVLRMEKNLSGALIGFIFSAILTSTLFHDAAGDILVPWAILASVISAVRLVFSIRSSFNPPVPCSRATIWRHAALDIVMALAMTYGPIWLLFHSDGPTALYMMLAVVTILWAGTLVHISVFPVSATFIAVQMLLWTGLAIYDGFGEHVFSTVQFWVTGMIACGTSFQVSTWLEEGLRQRIELEVQTNESRRQADTIALLLKEHEEESSDWLWHADATMRLRNVSDRFAGAFGSDRDAMEGRSLFELLEDGTARFGDENGRELFDRIGQHRSFRDMVVSSMVNDETRWWSISGRAIQDEAGQYTGYRGVMTDVTEEQRARTEAVYLAHHDPLTGLPNRRTFLDQTNRRLKSKSLRRFSVIYMDLDGFKLVNDRHGHMVGDTLLVEVARRLQEVVMDCVLVARMGGDEFVIKTRQTDREELETLCQRLLHAMSEPFDIAGLSVRIGASAGIAVAPDDGGEADVLLKNADAALYRAKQDGRNTYRFFAAALDREMQQRAELLHDLRNALPNGELMLFYQPFVDARSGATTGYEALMRWNHPERGLVPPLSFIGAAEESGLIIPMGAWVIHAACAEAATWDDDRRVSVNISPVQFRDRTLPECIRSALQASGLAPHRLEVEMTENVFVSDTAQALDMFRRIQALGVGVALDDFGTGYSSLSYLQCFDFDRIKIDRTFVHELSTRSYSQVIVRAVGEIARGLDMTITAEGVESFDQAKLLGDLGCHELQGYLYGRPEPVPMPASRVFGDLGDAPRRIAEVAAS